MPPRRLLNGEKLFDILMGRKRPSGLMRALKIALDTIHPTPEGRRKQETP
jgi:hypothetical protein